MGKMIILRQTVLSFKGLLVITVIGLLEEKKLLKTDGSLAEQNQRQDLSLPLRDDALTY